MIFMIEDKMPHARIFFHSGKPLVERVDKENLRYAYEDLTNAGLGVIDFVKILDGLCCGLYAPEELIIAGIIITDALDGYFVKEGFPQRAKYIRINDCDLVLLMQRNIILAGEEIDHCEFKEDNGKRYRFKIKRGLTAPTINPQEIVKTSSNQG